MTEHIFITGASGCIGSYVIDQLKSSDNCHLHLLARFPEKFSQDIQNNPHITIHQGDLKHIEQQKEVLSTMTAVIHIATDWSDSEYAEFLNVQQTHAMFSYCDPQKLRRIVYFSTASILGPNNRPTLAAKEHGSGYVRSKYIAYEHLMKADYASKIVTIFPTMVFGGDKNHPYSHISQGILPNVNWLKWLRFIYADGAFHFMHAKDIATMTCAALDLDTDKSTDWIVGFEPITIKTAIRTLCAQFNITRMPAINIPKSFIFTLSKWLRITIGPWEKHCIDHSNMVYDVINPSKINRPAAFPQLSDVVSDIQANA